MIEFKPCTDKKIYELLGKNDNGEEIVGYTAFEGGMETGYCVCNIEDTVARIILLQFSDDTPYIGDGLIKSALNYAAAKGVYIAVCSNEVKKNHVLPFGFTPSKDGYTGEIPEILMGKCHKFGNL